MSGLSVSGESISASSSSASGEHDVVGEKPSPVTKVISEENVVVWVKWVA